MGLISVSPNPVGIGQSVSVNFWIDKVPPTSANLFGDRWHGFTVTITKPDGSSEKMGPYTSDAAEGHIFRTRPPYSATTLSCLITQEKY